MKTYSSNISNKTRLFIILVCLLMLFVAIGAFKLLPVILAGALGFMLWGKFSART